MNTIIYKPTKHTFIGLGFMTAILVGGYFMLGYAMNKYTFSCDSMADQSKIAECQAGIKSVYQNTEYIREGMLVAVPIMWVLGMTLLSKYFKDAGKIDIVESTVEEKEQKSKERTLMDWSTVAIVGGFILMFIVPVKDIPEAFRGLVFSSFWIPACVIMGYAFYKWIKNRKAKSTTKGANQ